MAPPCDPRTASGFSYSLLNPLQNPNPLNALLSRPRSLGRRWNTNGGSRSRSLTTTMSLNTKSSSRYAILGAGFAGGGASGVAGGLLHPYSPKAKLLWKGPEFWKECLALLAVAEQANGAQVSEESTGCIDRSIVLRRGILRPPTSDKNVEILMEVCRAALDEKAAQSLIPGLRMPFDLAIYMPFDMSIHPKRYLQALFSACQNLANDESKSNGKERIITL